MRIKVSYVAEYVFDYGCVPELLRRFDSLVKNTEFDGIPPTVSFPNYEAAAYVAIKLLTLLGESCVGKEWVECGMVIPKEDAQKLRQDGFYQDATFVCQAYTVQPTKDKNVFCLEYIGAGKFPKQIKHEVSVEHEGVTCYGTKIEQVWATVPRVSLGSTHLTIVKKERTVINLEHS
jgi:hypothetical protein